MKSLIYLAVVIFISGYCMVAKPKIKAALYDVKNNYPKSVANK